jgi:hypothetical protein
VVPGTGDAIAGGQFRPAAPGASLNDDGAREPVLVQVTCDRRVTTTRLRISDQTASPAPAPLVPANRSGTVTSVAATAANDVWAATTIGTLKNPSPAAVYAVKASKPRAIKDGRFILYVSFRVRRQVTIAAGLPVVIVLGRALSSSSPQDEQLADLLAGAGVLAVFAGGERNQRTTLSEGRLVQFTGASLGYQSSQNNGVVWYSVSVDTDARRVDVKAIPVVGSLALKPLLGLTAARSSTLAFEAIGRRPPGSLATFAGTDADFPGFDSYVGIPAADCGTTSIRPTYSFTSGDPTIGDFVVPSGPGSRFPKLDAGGHPTASSTSGRFCAYNSGSTTVSITTGLLRASLPVTVQPATSGARAAPSSARASAGSWVEGDAERLPFGDESFDDSASALIGRSATPAYLSGAPPRAPT